MLLNEIFKGYSALDISATSSLSCLLCLFVFAMLTVLQSALEGLHRSAAFIFRLNYISCRLYLGLLFGVFVEVNGFRGIRLKEAKYTQAIHLRFLFASKILIKCIFVVNTFGRLCGLCVGVTSTLLLL